MHKADAKIDCALPTSQKSCEADSKQLLSLQVAATPVPSNGYAKAPPNDPPQGPQAPPQSNVSRGGLSQQQHLLWLFLFTVSNAS